jgi:Arc-like DNA binding domain
MARRSKAVSTNLVVRLPKELHAKLKKSAAAKKPANSLNREILERLTDSYETARDERVAKLEATVDSLQAMVELMAYAARLKKDDDK